MTDVLFPYPACSYLRWDCGFAVGDRCHIVPQRFPRHMLAGKVFVASMLTMAAAAVYIAILKHQPNNIGSGILTFYLIGTGWLTARRRDGETSRFDWVALLIPLTLGILTWVNGVKIVRSGATHKMGFPSG